MRHTLLAVCRIRYTYAFIVYVAIEALPESQSISISVLQSNDCICFVLRCIYLCAIVVDAVAVLFKFFFVKLNLFICCRVLLCVRHTACVSCSVLVFHLARSFTWHSQALISFRFGITLVLPFGQWTDTDIPFCVRPIFTIDNSTNLHRHGTTLSDNHIRN